MRSLAIRTRPIATPPKREEPSSNEPVAQEPSNLLPPPPPSPSPSTETSLVQLPVRSHPAVRPAQAPVTTTVTVQAGVATKSKSKAKARKTCSTAPILRKKGKVSKVRAQAKNCRKFKAPVAKDGIVRRLANNLSDACLDIMAKEDAAFENIYDTYMDTIDGSAAADAAFAKSLDDTLAVIWEPLECERVETITAYTRDYERYVTGTVGVNDRIQELKEHLEKNWANTANYWHEWEEMHKDFAEFGTKLFGRDFDMKMGAFEAEHARLLAEVDREIREAGEDYINEINAAELEFHKSTRNAKSMLFRFIL